MSHYLDLLREEEELSEWNPATKKQIGLLVMVFQQAFGKSRVKRIVIGRWIFGFGEKFESFNQISFAKASLLLSIKSLGVGGWRENSLGNYMDYNSSEWIAIVDSAKEAVRGIKVE